ncbi:glycoprotein-N-acetylgalactosamine 3-beta-galactosyltransferase 1-like [Haemaphysalis longicornis]
MARRRVSRVPGLSLVLRSRHLRCLRRALPAGCDDVALFCVGLTFGLAACCGVLDFLQPQQQAPPVIAEPRIVLLPKPHVPQYYDLNSTALYNGSDWVAKLLHDRVRVICFVLTHPANIRHKAVHAESTWGRHCNKLLFMSTQPDDALSSALNLSVIEGRNTLWAKIKASLVELYNKHYNDYDWFFKADDDTYAVMENMRFFLLDKDPSKPFYFGYPYRVIVKGGYMSGGPGYVLSREALRLAVEEGLTMQGRCRPDSRGHEDVEMGHCLNNVGVPAGDTHDALGRIRFFPIIVNDYLKPDAWNPDFWGYTYPRYPIMPGFNCCSDTAASFHYIKPNWMYIYEFFLYHSRIIGGTDQHVYPRPPPTQIRVSEVDDFLY